MRVAAPAALLIYMAIAVSLRLPRAEACPIKDNVVLLVLGVVEREPVVLRVRLREHNQDHDEVASEWTGWTSIVRGGEVSPVGEIAQLDAAKLAAAYRTAQALAAKRYDDFVPAEVVSAQSCGDAGRRTCGRVGLDRGGGVCAWTARRACRCSIRARSAVTAPRPSASSTWWSTAPATWSS